MRGDPFEELAPRSREIAEETLDALAAAWDDAGIEADAAMLAGCAGMFLAEMAALFGSMIEGLDGADPDRAAAFLCRHVAEEFDKKPLVEDSAKEPQ